MSYSLATLWYERQRYLPGVLAVSFSCLLIALQCGLLLGLFSITSIPIDRSDADVWVGHPEVPSVDLGDPIPANWISYVSAVPQVKHADIYMQGFGYWKKPSGGRELCMVIGSRLEGPDPLGAIDQLTPDLRRQLSEPNAVVVDVGEFSRLGIKKIGDTAEVNAKHVRICGTVRGLKSLAGPYVFCSLETAKLLMHTPPSHVTFILARCYHKEDARAVVEAMKQYPKKFSVFTAADFSFHSRWHWLTKTGAGIALGLAAVLGCLVGAVVTSQTLQAATAASIKEFAVLRALGIPRWRMSMTVMAQSFWIGVAGVAIALPSIYGLAWLASTVTKILLPWQLILTSVAITMAMALLSGLWALRSLRHVEPVTLLR